MFEVVDCSPHMKLRIHDKAVHADVKLGVVQNAKYPMNQLEVGQSFVVPYTESNKMKELNKIATAVQLFAKRRNDGRKFSTKIHVDLSVIEVGRIA